MKVLNMARASGKTSLLVKKSAETNHPILCRDYTSKEHIKKIASDLKLHIPEPVIADDLGKYKLLDQNRGKTYLVDELPYVFEKITGIRVDTATITCEDKEETKNTSEFSDVVSSLKQDAIDLQRRFTNAKNASDYRTSIDILRLLKDTLNLIKEYDWKLMFSEYETGLYTNGTLKKQVAIWEQNSEGNIRNHKVWDIDDGMRITLYDNQR